MFPVEFFPATVLENQCPQIRWIISACWQLEIANDNSILKASKADDPINMIKSFLMRQVIVLQPCGYRQKGPADRRKYLNFIKRNMKKVTESLTLNKT